MARCSQLGKKIFVGIFGLTEHFLSLISLGLFILRVWFEGRETETVITALFSALFCCVVCPFPPPPVA